MCKGKITYMLKRVYYDGRRWLDTVRIQLHYGDVMMSAMASRITSPAIGYSTVYSGADQRKYQSFASLAFVRGIHRWPVNSPHKWPVTQKMLPFDDVIMDHISQHCTLNAKSLAIITTKPQLNSHSTELIDNSCDEMQIDGMTIGVSSLSICRTQVDF